MKKTKVQSKTPKAKKAIAQTFTIPSEWIEPITTKMSRDGSRLILRIGKRSFIGLHRNYIKKIMGVA